MTKREIPCPQCGKPSIFAPENKSRPFCSERCRLIDLGEWASEGYQIPVEAEIDDFSSADIDMPSPTRH